LLLRVARLFHLIRDTASKAFKIGIGARCDDEQDTGKHCEAKSGFAQRHRPGMLDVIFKFAVPVG
jgi:hypothetical protein